jgi:polar amino acid transport system substrate-binding protein/arginine/ornithine transport system substrate-binding protein
MKFTSRIRLGVFAAALSFAGANAFAQEPLKIRIGVEGNYPPFSQIAPNGDLSGFDIDIANALCAQLKAQCTLVKQEWDGMIPALNVRKFDAIVASMTISEERKKVVDFTDPYYDVPSRFVAKAGAFKDHSTVSLKGKKIIVLRNSPRAKYVADNYKDSEVLLVTKEPDVYLELVAGRGDIGFGSSIVSAESFLKREQGKGYAQVGVGIAIRKGDDALRTRLNSALKEIQANGTYKKLATKYFDFDVSPNRAR